MRAMVYRFGDCSLDTQQHRLQRAGQPMRLRSSFPILCYLLEHRDRTVLKQELCEQVWPQHIISDATLESTVGLCAKPSAIPVVRDRSSAPFTAMATVSS